MAVFSHQLFLVAADLMFASALSFLFSAVGCLGLTGLVAYVVVLSFRSGVMKKAKMRISRKKEAVLSTVSNSCVGQTAGKMLDLVGSRGTGPGSWKQGAVLKEEYCSDLNLKQLPAGEKKCPKATKTLTGGHLSRTGISREMKKESVLVWEEERQTSQGDEHKVRAKWKNASAIPEDAPPAIDSSADHSEEIHRLTDSDFDVHTSASFTPEKGLPGINFSPSLELKNSLIEDR